jgi:hypothetical protein
MSQRQIAPLLAVLAMVPTSLPAQSQRQVEPHEFERLATFAHPRLIESSGVAVSRQFASVLWTHNDSGDEAVLFATNLRGENLGTFRVRGAQNEDWEDIAVSRCPEGPSAWCLYIADTGDNQERRPSVDIYIVREPDPHTDTGGETLPSRRLTVTYPTGPRDVEALAVAPDGEISLITKGRSGVVQRFRIPRVRPGRDSVQADLAETLDIIPRGVVGQVTGAAVSPDGSTLVFRTYTELHFYRRGADGSLNRLGVPCFLGFREAQGEAVDFLDAETMVLTSEAAFGQPASLSRVRCPTRQGAEP